MTQNIGKIMKFHRQCATVIRYWMLALSHVSMCQTTVQKEKNTFHSLSRIKSSCRRFFLTKYIYLISIKKGNSWTFRTWQTQRKHISHLMWLPVWSMILKSGNLFGYNYNFSPNLTSDRIFSNIEGSYVITTHAVQLFKDIITKSQWKTAE